MNRHERRAMKAGSGNFWKTASRYTPNLGEQNPSVLKAAMDIMVPLMRVIVVGGAIPAQDFGMMEGILGHKFEPEDAAPFSEWPDEKIFTSCNSIFSSGLISLFLNIYGDTLKFAFIFHNPETGKKFKSPVHEIPLVGTVH